MGKLLFSRTYALRYFLFMKSGQSAKRAKEGFITPKHGVLKIDGRLCYHEGSGGWSKLILKKDILELCRELQDKQKVVGYTMEYPLSEEAKKDFLKELTDDPECWPFMLRFKKLETPKE